MYFRVTIESIENLCYLAFLLWCLLLIILHKNLYRSWSFSGFMCLQAAKKTADKSKTILNNIERWQKVWFEILLPCNTISLFGVQCWFLFLTICPRESQALMVCSQLNSLIHDAYPSLLSRQLHFLLASRQLNFRVTSKQLV